MVVWHITKKILCFIVHFDQMESHLHAHPVLETGVMTEQEFVESSDPVLQVVNEKLRLRLYREAEAYVTKKDGLENGVQVYHLARILDYILWESCI